MGLTQKQRDYCNQYTIDSNATQSAIRAGYKKHRAGQAAYRLMQNPEIRDLIDKLTLQKARKTQMSAAQVLEDVCKIAQNKSARHSDRLKALELMGRHYNLWTESTPLEASNKDGSLATIVFYVPEKKPLPHEIVPAQPPKRLEKD